MLHELLCCKKRLHPRKSTKLPPTPVLSKKYRLVTLYEYFCKSCQSSNKLYNGLVIGYTGTLHDGSETEVMGIPAKEVESWMLYKAVGQELDSKGAHMVQRSNPVFPYQKQNVAVK